jgi:hypothetical protein
MKTDVLIAALAADATPVDAARAARRFDVRLAAGSALVLLGVLVVIGVRPDVTQAAALPMFWIKLVVPALVAAAAWVALRRLGHPGMRLGALPVAGLLPVVLLWLLAFIVLGSAPAGERLPLVLGSSAGACAVGIALLSLPALWLAVQACRLLAPTRLRLAGACAGLFAGAVAAASYALHCVEMSAPFVALWYVVGMLVPAALGALLGRRLLRW